MHSNHRGACRADAQKLCAGVEHGGGRILDCLAGQKDKLSDDCRKMVESRGKWRRRDMLMTCVAVGTILGEVHADGAGLRGALSGARYRG
jgi:hypothetical protein